MQDYKQRAEQILAGDNPAKEVHKLLVEIHELKRTRSEAEARAQVAGYQDGLVEARRRLAAQGIQI